MDLLKERILQKGKCLSGGVLKVDNFVNHQIDSDLMWLCAQEFAKLFANKGITKIVTLEASGIAPAIMVGLAMKLPMVFAKKRRPITMENALFSTVHSFTKGIDFPITMSKDFLLPTDRVLFIDDFLAYGCAATGIINLCRQAGATIVGMGFVIEKQFQNGRNTIRMQMPDVPIESLAIISSLENCTITFAD